MGEKSGKVPEKSAEFKLSSSSREQFVIPMGKFERKLL